MNEKERKTFPEWIKLATKQNKKTKELISLPRMMMIMMKEMEKRHHES